MAKNVSIIGMARIIIGIINEITVALFVKPVIDRMLIIYPMNRDPVSPIKILAG
jgi:hypothetical protein